MSSGPIPAPGPQVPAEAPYPITMAESWVGQRVLVVSPTPTHPLNFGNRRRIFHVCRQLQALGAEIHFLHYPAENDWRERLPLDAQRAMQAQWDSYTLVPPTRPLHPPAISLDHRIDEWWAPAIGDTLDWLFARGRFDVCIVNYAWLSRALEHCPPGVLRVLDTHDRFTGRRALLAAQGIAAEYFHTDAAEESIGLDRAHVAWAIKEEEEALFRPATRARVLTLGHVEPLAVTPRPAPQEVLRFGIIAARNSINLMNIRACVDAFVAHLARRLPPLEIVIAGSCCEALEDLRRFGFVRLMGPVAEVGEFYGAVDAVLSPIAISTGLKIKTGEALCHGRGVISLAHAFEGYLPTHRFHRLAGFAEMAAACEEVVRAPGLIQELEEASLRSVAQARFRQAAAFEATIAERRRHDRGVCIFTDAAAIHPGSVVADHALEVADALGQALPVVFHVGGTEAPDAASLDRLRHRGRVRLSPRIAALLAGAGSARAAPMPREAADMLGEGHLAYWFTCCVALPSPPADRVGAPVYLALDAMVQGASPAAITASAMDAAAWTRAVRIVARRPGPLASTVARASGAVQLQVPLFRHGMASDVVRHPPASAAGRLLVMADAADCPLAAAVSEIAGRLGWPGAVIVAPAASRAASTANAFIAEGLRRGGLPALAIDVAVDPRLEALREILDVGRTPVLRPFHGEAGIAALPAQGGSGGIFASVLHLADVLSGWPEPWAGVLELRRSASRSADAGWAVVRADIAASTG